MTELEDMEVEFVNADKVSGGYFGKVMNVFRDSAEENPGMKILQ